MTERQGITPAIATSRVFQFIDRLFARLWLAAQSSVAIRTATPLVRSIGALPSQHQRLGLGVLLLTAAVAHGLLMLLPGVADSRWWPLLPAIAAALGVVMLISSRTGR